MRRSRGNKRGAHGDHLVIDDRTGFTRWASDCQKEWNGLLVSRRVWEARHPQDFVRGVRDDMRVDPARPELDINSLPRVGPFSTTLAADAVAGDRAILVTDPSGFSRGDWIRIYLDNGDAFITQVVSQYITIDNLDITIDNLSFTIDSTYMPISTALPFAASAGNIVIDISNTTSPTLS